MIDKLLHRIYEQRKKLENDIEVYIDHEEYTLEEQRYDEGYDNALLWVSLEIARIKQEG